MILRSVNFSNQTPSGSSKALLFEFAGFLIDIEHNPLWITPHRIIDEKNAFSCKMFSCSSDLAFAFGSQIFFFANNGKKLGCVLYMGAHYTRVITVSVLFGELRSVCQISKGSVTQDTVKIGVCSPLWHDSGVVTSGWMEDVQSRETYPWSFSNWGFDYEAFWFV